jgi:hypothetical protein
MRNPELKVFQDTENLTKVSDFPSVQTNQPRDGLVRAHHVAEEQHKGVECSGMFFVGQCSGTVRYHDDFVIEHHRIACGRFAADISGSSGDHHGIDAPSLELLVKVRRAGIKAAPFADYVKSKNRRVMSRLIAP